MKASAKTLRIEVDANRLIKHTAPAMQRTMKRGFAVALMRKLDPHDPITTEEVDRLVAARSTAIQLEHDRQLDDVRRKVQRHLEFAARFEQVFGKSLDEWWKSAEVSALQLQRAIHLLSLSEYDRLETIEMTGEEIAKRARELQSLVPSVKNWNGAAEEEARRLAQLNAMPEEGESSNGR